MMTPPRSEPRTSDLDHATARLEDWLPERIRLDPDAIANFRWRVKDAIRLAVEAAHPTAASTDALRAALETLRRDVHDNFHTKVKWRTCEVCGIIRAALTATPSAEPWDASSESDDHVAATPSADEPDPDYMCPNCVTPWKCNGPHIVADEPTVGLDVGREAVNMLRRIAGAEAWADRDDEIEGAKNWLAGLSSPEGQS